MSITQTAIDHAPDAAIVINIGRAVTTCCAPIGMQREVVEMQVTAARPYGNGWRLVTRSVLGRPMAPRPCSLDATRQHWALTARRKP